MIKKRWGSTASFCFYKPICLHIVSPKPSFSSSSKSSSVSSSSAASTSSSLHFFQRILGLLALQFFFNQRDQQLALGDLIAAQVVLEALEQILPAPEMRSFSCFSIFISSF